MGTNYYARFNICKECNRYDEIHIGKSSAGWTFTFHATEDIRSYKDWIKFLSKPNIKIFTEYLNTPEVKLEDFKRLVESKKESELIHARVYPNGNDFLDEEGNSMTEEEFS